MFKNVATKLAIFAFDITTGAAKTGDAANLTAYVSKDYGSVTVLGDTSATEMDATNAKGWYLFDLAQAETNADALLFTGKSATANISLVGQLIFTTPANFTTLSIDSNGRTDTIKIAGTTQTARDLGASMLLSPGTGTGQVSLSSGTVTLTDASLTAAKIAADAITAAKIADGAIDAATFAAGAINAAAIAADAFTAAKFASDVTTEFQTGLATALEVADAVWDEARAGHVAAGSFGQGVASVQGAVTGSVASVTAGVTLAAAAVQAIWDAATSALTTAGSIGKRIADFLTGDAFVRLGAPAGASHAADTAAVKVDTAAVKVQTDKFVFSVANQVDSNVIDWKGATAPAMTGDAYARLGASAGASVSADVAAVKVDSAAIKAKTDNLPASPANEATLTAIAGYIDTEVAAIKAKTDNLPSSPAAVGAAMTLTSGERDSIAAALLDLVSGIETGITLRQSLRLQLAALVGKLAGAATTTITIRNTADNKNRIIATVDADGNRSAVTLDAT